MRKTPSKYTEEFRRDAVRLVETSGRPKTQIARDLGISDSALYRWLKEYGQDQTLGASPNGPSGSSLKELEAENKRLRREVEVLRQERDILKKAISICSQERG
jgi:transposase